MMISHSMISVEYWKYEVCWNSKDTMIVSSFGGLRYFLGESGIWIKNGGVDITAKNMGRVEWLTLLGGQKEGEEYSRKKE